MPALGLHVYLNNTITIPQTTVSFPRPRLKMCSVIAYKCKRCLTKVPTRHEIMEAVPDTWLLCTAAENGGPYGFKCPTFEYRELKENPGKLSFSFLMTVAVTGDVRGNID